MSSEQQQTDFVAAVEAHLALAGVAFERRDLLAFVAACWPRVLEDPDPGRWAGLFLERLTEAAA
jgi:hypothetical protein